MSLIGLVVILIVIGLVLYLLDLLPLDAKIRSLIRIVVVVFVILWLLTLFLPALGTVHLGR